MVGHVEVKQIQQRLRCKNKNEHPLPWIITNKKNRFVSYSNCVYFTDILYNSASHITYRWFCTYRKYKKWKIVSDFTYTDSSKIVQKKVGRIGRRICNIPECFPLRDIALFRKTWQKICFWPKNGPFEKKNCSIHIKKIIKANNGQQISSY